MCSFWQLSYRYLWDDYISHLLSTDTLCFELFQAKATNREPLRELLALVCKISHFFNGRREPSNSIL